jgi:hypothetical protein
MRKLGMALLALLACAGIASAQKIVLKSGSFEQLKKEKFLNIEYDYSEIAVGRYKKEAEYVEYRKAEIEKKEAGRGARWEEAWHGDKVSRFPQKFEQLLNKYLEKPKVFVGKENSDAKYTMIVKTTFIEPGFNVAVHRKPAMIDVVIIFVETANRSNVVAELIAKGSPGTSLGNDYDAGERIQEAYAKCGKSVGIWLAGKAFK